MSQNIVSTWDGVANTNSWVHDGDVERSAADIIALAESVAHKAEEVEAATTAGVAAVNEAGSEQMAAIEGVTASQVAIVEAAGTAQKSAVETEGAAQIAAIGDATATILDDVQGAGATQIAAVQSAAATQLAAVEAAGTDQVSAVEDAADAKLVDINAAKDAAVAAKEDAEAAQAAAETAQAAAEASAGSVASSAAQIAANAEGIARLNGASYQLKCFGDATSFPSGIGGNIYKCTEKLIPAETVLRSVEIQAWQANVSGYLFILDADDVIVDKYFLPATQAGWNTIAVNKRYKQDVYIAVRGMATYFTYTMAAAPDIYSVGLMEASGDSYGGRVIGQSIPFTHNVPTRYYQFAVKIDLASLGVTDLADELPGISAPFDFILPRMAKMGEQGYSLFGKWYRMTDTQSQCASCGGASIAFTVKGATTVSVDIEQLVYHDDPAYMMAEEPYIAYSVDGAAFTRVQIATNAGNSVKTIALGSTAEHFVWIVMDGMCQSSGGANRSTGWSGVYVKSLTSNGTMYKVRPKGRQILYVGDSMVEGINTLGTSSLSSSNSNVAEWSFKSALKLHAFPLMQGYGGSTTWTGDSFELYSRPDYAQDTYIVNNQPDVIVCAYGHNDYSLVNAGTKTEAEFIAQYQKLAADLSGHYPGIPVVFLVPFAQRLSSAVRTVAAAYPFYYVVETYGYDYQTTDGTHPSAASGTAMAGSFADDMVRLLGKAFFA